MVLGLLKRTWRIATQQAGIDTDAVPADRVKAKSSKSDLVFRSALTAPLFLQADERAKQFDKQGPLDVLEGHIVQIRIS
jgi:hypothetical protein